MLQAVVGRFAPTPSGPLHAGSLVAALGSWLDARAHRGRWLLRIEDLDTARMQADATQHIARQLQSLGLQWDGDIRFQSEHQALYQSKLDRLILQGMAYPCTCTRQAILADLLARGQAAPRGAEWVYPGSCREGPRLAASTQRSWRLRVATDQGADVWLAWHDRRHGAQNQNITQAVGDFVLKRADGPWAYQLAVVADDAAQGVTHVVRGDDLLDNTARQIWLQGALGLPTPSYLHLPLVKDARGDKLSKSNGAPALRLDTAAEALDALNAAAEVLGLPRQPGCTQTDLWLNQALGLWSERYAVRPFS